MTNRTQPTFLIAEDDLLDYRLLKRAIDESGFSCTCLHFETGPELLEYLATCDLKENPISAIFLDLKMPIMSGLEVLEKIRSIESARHVPVVMISASSLPADVKTAFELGVNGFLLKEMNRAEFKKSVEHLVWFWGRFNQQPSV